MRNIFLFEDESKTDLTIVTNEQCVVVKSNRSELQKISSTKELTQPGVYFLLSEDLIYVGQSGRNVMNRIISHHSEKTWWTDFLVITDSHGELEKTMTEYMEAYFIALLNKHGVTLDNEQKGLSSKISMFTKMKSDVFISKGLNIITNIFHINLLKQMNKVNTESLPTHSKVKIIINGEQEVIASNIKKALSNTLNHLTSSIEAPYYARLLDEETSTFNKRNVIAFGNEYKNNPDFAPINGELFLYNKISEKDALNLVTYFSELLDINLEVEYL